MPLELEAVFRFGVLQRRLEVSRDDFPGVRVDVGRPVVVGLRLAGVDFSFVVFRRDVMVGSDTGGFVSARSG